jgi:transcription elongation factor Elf1
MAKANRGRNLVGVQKKRGKCPICNRSGVKLLHTRKEGEKTINVCKQCKS